MSSETVKPMPESAAPPSTWPDPTPRGKAPSPSRTVPSDVTPIPTSLPTTRATTTPQVTGEERASASTPSRRSTPALASANSGTIT